MIDHVAINLVVVNKIRDQWTKGNGIMVVVMRTEIPTITKDNKNNVEYNY